jgi:hypothetical protein
LLTVPDVPVMVSGNVPFLVPLEAPLQPARAAKMRIAVTIPSRVRKRLAVNTTINKSSANTSGTVCLHESGGAGLVGGSSGAIPWAVKVAVAV